ncbi:hypothetical protein DFH11DRAFT_1520241 [Phellopilus nigrolimitatus]|nr:hypothetical protein DFH11DRAFT_1520241 [Phellopilus nigrolimitatus]
MAGILVHQVSAETKVRTEIDERDIGFFSTQPANSLNTNADGRPYITIVMELGVQPFNRTQAEHEVKSITTKAAPAFSTAGNSTTAMTVAKSSRRPATVAHARYSIFAIGCSPSVYKLVDSKNVYTTLLSSRHILQEDSRQTSTLSRFIRMIV